MSILSWWLELAEATQHLDCIEHTEPRQQSEPKAKCEVIQQSEATQQRYPKEQSECTTILNLPIELLLQIISYLPLSSQALLALSSRSLYQQLGWVLQDDALRFPLWPPKREVYYNRDRRERKGFLLQLEDIRWAYCADCRKLHPRGDFSEHGLMRNAPDKRSCNWRWAGLVNICPCLTFNATQSKANCGISHE